MAPDNNSQPPAKSLGFRLVGYGVGVAFLLAAAWFGVIFFPLAAAGLGAGMFALAVIGATLCRKNRRHPR